MKRIGILCIGLLVALTAVAAFSSEAFASTILDLDSGGVPANTGSTAAVQVTIDECTIVSEAHIGANEKSKDTVIQGHLFSSECGEDPSSQIEGATTEVQLTTKGKVSMKGTIAVRKPGPCVYEYKKFKTTVPVPGFLRFTGRSVGKLAKRQSTITCPKTDSSLFQVEISPNLVGPPAPFEAVLRG